MLNVNDKKKLLKKTQYRLERVYNLDELHKEFTKKHQITESITEKQLESYLQYYFDLKTNCMKPLKDDIRKYLNVPQKEFSIIKKAFEESKTKLLPRKEDMKYFVGQLENKRSSVEFNQVHYNLKEPKSLINNKDLFTVSISADKIKPKTSYTIHENFCNLMKELGIFPQTFDCHKACPEEAFETMFNKYNYNQVLLYQPIDLKNIEILNMLDIDSSNYVLLDYAYIKPKLLKDLISERSDNGLLLEEYVAKLSDYTKLHTVNGLCNHLKTITYHE